MSGGKFGYQDYNIRIIADHIEEEVIMSGKPIPKQNWDYSMIQHPETAVNPSYEDSTLLRMAEAVYALKKAEIYAIAWTISYLGMMERRILRPV